LRRPTTPLSAHLHTQQQASDQSTPDWSDYRFGNFPQISKQASSESKAVNRLGIVHKLLHIIYLQKSPKHWTFCEQNVK